jgi:hypothetical protein
MQQSGALIRGKQKAQGVKAQRRKAVAALLFA